MDTPRPRAPRLARVVVVLAVAVVVVTSVAIAMLRPAGRPDQAGASAGATPSAAVPVASPGPDATIPPIIGSASSPMSAHLSGDVYGYLPYWEMDATIEAYLDWNALSVISLFSVGAGSTGALDGTGPGYRAITSAQGRRIIATAEAHGVRTEITFTSFGASKNATFFGSAPAQAQAIADLRALVKDLGAGGVNVDVELIAGTWFPAYAAFVGNLRAALRTDNPSATVSVATNGNTSGAQMAKAATDAGADRVFMMGYGYRSAGSAPGAIDPLAYRGGVAKLDLAASLALYAKYGVPNAMIILGLPFYGLTWPTVDGTLGSASTAAGSTFIPRLHLSEIPSGSALQYDPGESVSWFATQDPVTGAWQQTFFDTPSSLAPKFQLAVDRHLAGIGVWTLGYDRGLSGYWDLVESVFGPPKVLSVSAPARTRGPTITLTYAAIPGSRPLAFARFSNDGRTWTSPSPIPPVPDGADPGAPQPPLAWTLAGAADGSHPLWVQVIDEGGTASTARAVTVILDRTGPLLATAPTVRWSATAHAWRASWEAAVDPSGVAGYQVRVRVGSGAWTVVEALTTGTDLTLAGLPRTALVSVSILPRDRLGNWSGAAVVGRSPH